jgi:hypothetical protein
VPVAFALSACVFSWLYEAWIRALVMGPLTPGSDDSSGVRRRSIRLVFAAEAVLVTVFLALAHGLLDVDWTARSPWPALTSIAGALLGVLGCALALSSDLVMRRYRAVPNG